MNEFDILGTAASGMRAQRTALEFAARNVAASEADGSFTREIPRFNVIERGGAADVRLVGVTHEGGTPIIPMR